jgi:hypothetical protein
MGLTLTTLWAWRPIPTGFAILKRVFTKTPGATLALFAASRTIGCFAFIF